MHQQLIDKVKAQIDLYEKHKELSGENFNIFSIMSMENDEVFTHSAIIAELLNPSGTHGMGEKPLKLFIEQFFDDKFKFEYKNVTCKKEEHIGKINEDKTEGGRLDIVVKNSLGQIFVIENKIYALEQKNQLLRYSNKYENVKIFYLTLYGEDSKQIVDNEKNKVYQTISYKSDVLDWIQECVKYAYDKPMVREVLKQYIYLIKNLTNQTNNEDMSEKIIEIVNENFEASSEIHKNFEKALIKRQNVFFEKIKANLKAKHFKSELISEVEIIKKNDIQRLFIHFLDGYYLSFLFRNTKGLLLIGGEKFRNVEFEKDFLDFKKPDWIRKESDNTILWKYYKDFSNSTKFFIEFDKKNENEQKDSITEFASSLVNIIEIFNAFIKEPTK